MIEAFFYKQIPASPQFSCNLELFSNINWEPARPSRSNN